MAKVNVSIPDDLLDQVDAIAKVLHRSRSGLVQEATAQYVARVNDERVREERRISIESSMTAAREMAGRVPAGVDTTELIRRDRDRGYGNAEGDE
jgi:metal-responsive CopG/Arc/MetJ family transcriptional regulator